MQASAANGPAGGGAPSPAAAAAAGVESILRALAALHAPDTPAAQRAQAQQYCEQVKAQPQQCLAVSLSLLQLPVSSLGGDQLAPAARHFALHALQHLIAHGWNGLSEEEKSYMKSQAVGIAQNCTALSGGVRFLKQTVARIVTEIALREWPQRWPNMLEVLFAACGQSPPAAAASSAPAAVDSADSAGTELLALIFRNLSEEATGGETSLSTAALSSSLPEQRRRDVQQGLMHTMEVIFPWIQTALRGSVLRFASNKSDTQSLRTCRALLECLGGMLDFLPAKWVFETGLLEQLCGNLSQPDLFESICELLASVANRKSSTLDASYGPQLVAVWDASLGWMQSLIQQSPSPSFPKQTQFTNKVLAVVNNLTRGHADLLSPPKFDAVKQKELSVLGALLNHSSSQKISFVALELWVHLFRHHASTIIKPEYRASLLSELLKIACVRLIKRPSGATADEEDDEAGESVEEYNQFFGVYRGSLLQLITLMAEMEPLLCFQVVLMRYQHLLSLPAPSDSLSPEGFVSMRTGRFLEWEATGSLLECLFRSVGNQKWNDPALGTQLRQVGENLVQTILAFKTEDPLLQTRRLHVLGMPVPVLASSAPLLDATLDALLAGISFRPSSVPASVPWAQLSEDLKACRRRAIVSLIQLARRREQLVLPFLLSRFPALVARILDALGKQLISEEEKIALFEFLVLIALELPSADERNNFLQSILQDRLSSWSGPATTSLMAFGSGEVAPSTPPPFLQLLGMSNEEQSLLSTQQTLPPGHKTEAGEQRKAILHSLHTFMAIFKPLFIVHPPSGSSTAAAPSSPASTTAAAAPPAASSEAANAAAGTLLPMVLPNMLRLLGHIYHLRSSATRSFLPAHMVSILAPSAEQLLHPDAAPLSTHAPETPKHFHLLWAVRRWMDKVLDACIHLLMLAAKSGSAFYSLLAQPPVARLLYATCFEPLGTMHLREARALMDKFLEVMLMKCPPAMYVSVFMSLPVEGGGPESALLPGIFSAVRERVSRSWAAVQNAKQLPSSAGVTIGAPSASPAAAAPAASSTLSSEILEESELRELSRCMSEGVSKVVEAQYVTLHAAHLAAASQSSSGGGSLTSRERERLEKERRQQEGQLLMQTPLCQFIFTQPALLSSLFELLLTLLTCPDSAASVRSIRLAHRLLPVCVGAHAAGSGGSTGALGVDLYARVFEAGVVTLARGSAQLLDVVEMELIALLKDLYVALALASPAPLSPAPRALLSSLPGGASVAQDLQQLDATLRSVCAEKKHRNAMRSFFDRHVKAARVALQQQAGLGGAINTNPLEQVAQKGAASTVRDLEPLNLPARARAAKPDDDDDSGAIMSALFQ